jgi:very-short-patch-repair endonuclease
LDIHKAGWFGEWQLLRRLRSLGMIEGMTPQWRVGRYRLDFAWPAVKVGLEADGWVHRAPSVREHDVKRDANLTERGWYVHRVDVHEFDEQAMLAELIGLRALMHRLNRWEGSPAPGSWREGRRESLTDRLSLADALS